MPLLQQFQVALRDEWPNIKLMIMEGPRQIYTDTKQYDVALNNFEVQLRNVLRAKVEAIIKARQI